ncbi:MAG: RNA pseudouridine synthase [Saprospiraceae bacterium]|nr:RNA pseudouridine synthase [Saprospiraceae bacterium]
MNELCFRNFKKDIHSIEIPAQFPDPFSHDISDIAKLAASELQEELEASQDYQEKNNTSSNQPIGKMYGVLVVQDKEGKIFYLAGFSGKLEQGNLIQGFVPPIFNLFVPQNFFRLGETEINKINREIEELEKDPKYLNLQKKYDQLKTNLTVEFNRLSENLKAAKNLRAIQRENILQNPSDPQMDNLIDALNKESIKDHFTRKDFKRNMKHKLEELDIELNRFKREINSKKQLRKDKSASLQDRIFKEFSFLNCMGELKSLQDIFPISKDVLPPSGAGECAAPKLLHYAFTHKLKVIALAEFWWGANPESEIRRHKTFYPPCKSKCVPILSHMLEGIEIATKSSANKILPSIEIPVLFEDDYLLVINKPSGLLSVPGLKELPSVYSILKEKYPQITGPTIVHRLDMGTSGIMIIAKNIEIYQNLQAQFINRTIKKTYLAILDGEINNDKGEINLPLRVDLEDRPRQLVCHLYGKTALTKYRVLEKKKGLTAVEFTPYTGRTHQLRIHSAHKLGLNTPIVGDELYGSKKDRLMLHANSIEFLHPILSTIITIRCNPEFTLKE